jgi:hypothetical protein
MKLINSDTTIYKTLYWNDLGAGKPPFIHRVSTPAKVDRPSGGKRFQPGLVAASQPAAVMSFEGIGLVASPDSRIRSRARGGKVAPDYEPLKPFFDGSIRP